MNLYVPRIRAATDVGNAPMAAAFTLAGCVAAASRAPGAG